MREHNERYIPVALPSLPFKDNHDLLLSSHFLFMYSDSLGFQFHLNTIDEMLRVTKEVIRIFPTIDLEGNEYKYLNEIKDHLVNRGCE